MANRFDLKFDRLLKGVSRSFYLTMRVLPGAVRPQIGLAYLLARATDTIADTEVIPVQERLRKLNELRERILGETQRALELGTLIRAQGGTASDAERQLLERIEEALEVLDDATPVDRDLIRKVLDTITSGQVLDLERFGSADAKRVVALQNATELDDYTYRVAGCVGEFWTRICRAHLFPEFMLDEGQLVENGIRFGKGLQLVNILRDIPADLRNGRCYIPADALQRHALVPVDLLKPESGPAFRRLHVELLDLASAHLAAGWAYTVSLPFRYARLRLACSWPLLIGLETLQKLREQNVLDPAQRIKLSRSEVRGILLRSVLWYPWPGKWNSLFASARR